VSGSEIFSTSKAIFTANPQEGTAPLTVNLDASQSFDEDGQITNYYWFLGESTIPFDTGVTTTKTFTQKGEYIVKLKVVDDQGAKDVATKTITVKSPVQENRPPVADFSYNPQNPKIFQTISFDGSLSTDPDNDTLTYSWDFDNDGLFDSFAQKPTFTYSKPGNYPVKLEVSDGNLKDSVTKTVKVTANLEVEDINCFDKIVQGHNQSCSVLVTAQGKPVKNAEVNIYFDDEQQTLYGTCQTNRLGNCRVNKAMSETGNFVVFATAQKPGYINDLDKEPKFYFTVYRERYEIEDLKVFSDPEFETESYEFFRGENLYLEFRVVEKNTNTAITQDIVTKATLVSQGHETADLTKTGLQNQKFRYKLTPIPLSYGFIGQSQVFAFAFNFSDGSGGQQQVDLLIKNNLPMITPKINDVVIKKGETAIIDLSQHEYDKEDEYSQTDDLYWKESQTTQYFTTSLQDKTLTITGVEQGHGVIFLELYDWDKDYDVQMVKVDVVEQHTENHPPVIEPIGDKEVFVGETISFAVSANDPDNDSLSIEAFNLPTGASFQNNVFSWTPTIDQLGISHVKFVASDGKLEDSETISILVKQTIPGLFADINGPYEDYPNQNIKLDASNSQGDITQYTFDFGDGEQRTTNKPYIFHAYSGTQQSYIVTLTVTDVYGNTAHDSTTVTMLEPEKEQEKTTSTYVGGINLYGLYSNKAYTSVDGEDLVVSIVVKNDGETDQKDMTITAMVPELGIKRKTSSFSLDDGDSTIKQLFIPTYYAPRGEYYLKLVIGNDGDTRVKHRYFIVE